MVLFCVVVLICVGGCTSKAPLSPAIVPVPGASYDLCVTACVVAMCCAGSGDCGVERCGRVFLCVALTVSLAATFSLFPALSPCGLKVCVHPAVDRVKCAW